MAMAPRHAESPRVVVTCRIEPELLKRLDTAAEADRRSRSEMIEQAVREMLDRQQPAPKRPTK
jgi:predicted transcriptional regulator